MRSTDRLTTAVNAASRREAKEVHISLTKNIWKHEITGSILAEQFMHSIAFLVQNTISLVCMFQQFEIYSIRLLFIPEF